MWGLEGQARTLHSIISLGLHHTLVFYLSFFVCIYSTHTLPEWRIFSHLISISKMNTEIVTWGIPRDVLRLHVSEEIRELPSEQLYVNK